MGYRLKTSYQQHKTIKGLESRLQRFMTMILLSGNQLNVLADKITVYRALQMDGDIEYDEEMEEKMNTMEEYVADRFIILQDMREKVLFAKKVLLSQQRGRRREPNTSFR